MATAIETETTVPPLLDGDRLTADEFLRRYDAMPHLKKAELIDGIVFIPQPTWFEGHAMASPVSHLHHAEPHLHLVGWLTHYMTFVDGITGGDNGTVRLDLKNIPQPDTYLMIRPDHGGRITFDAKGYVQGTPDLVAEVSYSTASRDLRPKFAMYREHGAREYLVWRVADRAIDWFTLRGDRYERLQPGADGLLRSETFPGLWLDPTALIAGDLRRVFAVVQQGLASPDHAAFVARLAQAAHDQP